MKKGFSLNEKRLFFGVSSLGFVITLFCLFLSKGQIWSEILEENGYFYMGDFLMHVLFVKDPARVYLSYEGCCFPPLAYVFYLIINRILPAEGITTMSDYKLLPATNLIYFCLVSLCMMVIAIFIYETFEKKLPETILAAFLILFSEPFFAGAIERGNSVLLTLVLLLLALRLKEEDNPVAKEAALLLIAVAACFKIYPAIFGFLYLYEKRYKEALRLVIYGVLLFFLPFLFFGGIPGFQAFVHNLMAVGKKSTADIYTISGCVEWLYAHLCHTEVIPQAVHIAGRILSFAYLLLAMWFGYLERQSWKRLLYFSSLMVVFTNSSYPYTTIYLLLPFLSFLRNEGDDKKPDSLIYAFCFGLIFTTLYLPGVSFRNLFGGSFAFLLRYLTLYPMLLFAMIQSAGRILREKKCP